MMYNL